MTKNKNLKYSSGSLTELNRDVHFCTLQRLRQSMVEDLNRGRSAIRGQ